jgi:hypothetical protein
LLTFAKLAKVFFRSEIAKWPRMDLQYKKKAFFIW